MIDYLKSEAVKNYLQEKKIELDDKLKYALIIDRYTFLPVRDIEESLRELAAETGDEEIKAQAPVWIRNKEKEYGILARGSGPAYCYMVKYGDGCDELYGSYGTLELAVKAGILAAKEYECEIFDVEKEYQILSQTEFEKYEVSEDAPYSSFDRVRGRYTADGKLLYCTESENAETEEIEDPIEERFYIIPHPFRRGDIVKSKYAPADSKDVYMILENEDDEMNAQKQRKAWLERNGAPAVWDHMNMAVSAVDLETGMIWDSDSQTLPVDLEFYPLAEKTEDVGEQVLLCISDLLKGKIASPQYIQNGLMKLRADFDEKNRSRLITGVELPRRMLPGK